MAQIHDQPTNINFLSPLGFRFKLKRAPNVNFFVTDANLPSLTLSVSELPTPFKNIPLAGHKLEYGDFSLTFRVDEDLTSYLELYNWLISIGIPENFTQYQNLKDAQTGSPLTLYSDATLTIMTSGMVPNLEVNFEDLFPVSLGNLDFTATDIDVNYITVNATFKYKIFHVKKL
jgi:hypothetical protein